MNILIPLLFLLTAASGTGVALSREPRRQVMAMAVNGLVLSVLFMALQAPDVSFAELAVGSAAVPLLFLVVLASIRMDRSPRGDETDRSPRGDVTKRSPQAAGKRPSPPDDNTDRSPPGDDPHRSPLGCGPS